MTELLFPDDLEPTCKAIDDLLDNCPNSGIDIKVITMSDKNCESYRRMYFLSVIDSYAAIDSERRKCVNIHKEHVDGPYGATLGYSGTPVYSKKYKPVLL